MRSFGFTLILALIATFVCGVAGWHWVGGSFDSVLGTPPNLVGQRLYSSFTPDQVKHIRVKHNGVDARFSLGPDGWQADLPWQDRMDPRAAVAIINFALGMRIEDVAPFKRIDRVQTGLREGFADIELDDGEKETLARFRIGRRTPWMAEVEGMEAPVPTVYIQNRERKHRDFVYACTGDIAPLFKDGLKFLRDHRPFYFNPIALQKIRIRSSEGEVTLGRETPQSPWRVVKPLDTSTDPVAMKALIEGIYELQAAKVSDRASVTLPVNGSAAASTEIAITSFGEADETVLEIFPPETPEASDAKATVSDRPGTVFDLPLKAEPNLVSIADLPLAVNDLRDPTLTNLNIQSLAGISILPSTGAEILITRSPPQPWMATIEGQSREANEERLFSLLKAVTEGRAIGFETDAATDFTAWGLDRPFLRLRFLAKDNQVLELAFGVDGKGAYFVNRKGTPTVMRVDESLVAGIAVRPYEWRPSRMWSIDRSNIIIERTRGAESPLFLKYRFSDEMWQATRDGKDITPEIDPARANFMLGTLEGLKVSRWLSPSDEGAANALAAPILTFKVMEQTTDDMGDLTGLITRSVRFAPNTPGPEPGFYYGRLDSDPNPFLLDPETFGKLATDVLDQK